MHQHCPDHVVERRLLSFFPDPELADESGLIAVGGDLRPDRLIEAYANGIFPWYDEDVPVMWWSPDPRAIIELDGLHVSRRLARTIRSQKFHVTINAAFADVLYGCAQRKEGTWITSDMIDAYADLHLLGLAHSVETWRGDELIGGIYGVAIGGLFAAESMFSRCSDASKVALAFLVERLRQRGFTLLDIQLLSDHTKSLGAIEIPRREYLLRLRKARKMDVSFAERP